MEEEPEVKRATRTWRTAVHNRPRAPNGAGLRAWGDGVCIDPQCKHVAHFRSKPTVPPMSDEDRGFAQGIALAVAILARMHDQPTIAADVASEAGYTIADYERAGVDEYDLKVLRKLRRDEARFPRGARATKKTA
jgi:hypothetical protein